MQVNLKKIEAFYKSELGVYAHNRLSRNILRLITKPYAKMTCVSSSAGFIHFNFLKNFHRLALQSYHICDDWPEMGQGHYIVTERQSWPYQDEDVDVVFMVHDIEFSDRPDAYLCEAWRVLKGEGELIITFPNRSGKWARFDTTPFGLGYPYTLKQMQNLLHKSGFTIELVEKSLFFPAYQPKTAIVKFVRNMIDSIGHYCFCEAGVYILKAKKHIYAPTKGLRIESAAQKAKQVLFPSPVVPTAKTTRSSCSSKVT